MKTLIVAVLAFSCATAAHAQVDIEGPNCDGVVVRSPPGYVALDPSPANYAAQSGSHPPTQDSRSESCERVPWALIAMLKAATPITASRQSLASKSDETIPLLV
jgi:hypothetical protein